VETDRLPHFTRWLIPVARAVRPLKPIGFLLVILAVAGAVYVGTNPGAEARSSAEPAKTATPAPTPPPVSSPTPLVEPESPAPEPLSGRGDGPYGTWRTTGDDYVGLTFDDGPDPTYTPQVLALLRKHEVKATFCLVGVNAKAYPELVRAIAADGHTLCNHSWNHDFRLGSRSRSAIRADLERTNAAIRDAVPGADIRYFRQPGGNWTKSVVAVARELGMTSLHWEVDPQDWRRPGARSIANQVISGTVRGAIVLLHDGGGDRQGTVEALRSILPSLTRRFTLAALPCERAPLHRVPPHLLAVRLSG
jgi:peptidoglycan-N-acetylglucosamine deacetylase